MKKIWWWDESCPVEQLIQSHCLTKMAGADPRDTTADHLVRNSSSTVMALRAERLARS